jgi:signal peptidase I
VVNDAHTAHGTEATATATATESHSRASRSRRRRVSAFLENVILMVITAALVLLIRSYLGSVFVIPTKSMDPTLMVGDRIVVSRLSYRLHDVRRGDIVVFQNPAWKGRARRFPLNILSNLGEVVGIGQDEEKMLVKRVIGLPGETITEEDGKVFVDGKKIAEPYLVSTVTTDFYAKTYKVLPDTYFMLGDNRGQSADSRFFYDTTGNPAPFVLKDRLVGHAFFRVWPVSRIGKP